MYQSPMEVNSKFTISHTRMGDLKWLKEVIEISNETFYVSRIEGVGVLSVRVFGILHERLVSVMPHEIGAFQFTAAAWTGFVDIFGDIWLNKEVNAIQSNPCMPLSECLSKVMDTKFFWKFTPKDITNVRT